MPAKMMKEELEDCSVVSELHVLPTHHLMGGAEGGRGDGIINAKALFLGERGGDCAIALLSFPRSPRTKL